MEPAQAKWILSQPPALIRSNGSWAKESRSRFTALRSRVAEGAEGSGCAWPGARATGCRRSGPAPGTGR